MSLLVAAITGVMATASTINFGYAPTRFQPDQITGHGTGMNNFIEGVVKLDPVNDPVVRSLKGSKITAVRCYMRNDYKQKTKGFSSITTYEGSITNEPTRKLVNLKQGWNEVALDEPITIGEESVYVGARVFEMINAPYPFVSFKYSRDPNGNFINSNNTGFQDMSARGNLLIQAVVEPAGEVPEFARVELSDVPQVVGPGQQFSGSLYVHNFTASPISNVTIKATDPVAGQSDVYSISLDTAVVASNGQVVPLTLKAPMSEGMEQALEFQVESINGKEVNREAGEPKSEVRMFVSGDVFVRIPVIEEFTGLECVNCPMMFYYLDQALELEERPLIYVAHHAGFVEDVFTKQADRELLYLFGTATGNNTYNPAAMYDRRVLDSSGLPVYGAKSADVEPYTEKIEPLYNFPGLAQVLVDCDRSKGDCDVTVHGRLSKSVMPEKDNIRIATFLIEDGISERDYPQKGVSIDPIDGAPKDLADRYKHNGVIRQVLNTNPAGDPLTLDADGNFSIDYKPFSYDSEWDEDNCQMVSLVYFYNPDDLNKNYMLNSGSEHLNSYAKGVGINNVIIPATDLIKIGANRCLQFADTVTQAAVYDLTGRVHNAYAPLPNGMYIVRVTTATGQTSTRKIIIK